MEKKIKENLLCLKEKLKLQKKFIIETLAKESKNINDNIDDFLDFMVRCKYNEIFSNPKLETEENYQQESFTGYASIDKPHLKYFRKGILDAKFPKMKMYDYLYLRNIKRQNFTALNYFGRKITYNEMFSHIDDVAKSFKKMGIKEGDYVVIAMPTTPESVYMLFALNRIGAIPVELDPRTTKEDVIKTIEESKTKFYITMEDCSVMIDELLSENSLLSKQVENVMFISPTESLPFGLNYLSDFKDFIERMKKRKPIVPKNDKYLNWTKFIEKGESYKGKIDSLYKEGEVAEIIYSSGTTASPKPIEYTNETFTAMVRQVELMENDYKEKDKNLDIIPLFLGFGSNNGIYTILAFGLEDILIPVPVIENLPSLISKYEPNHILCAPIHIKVLNNYLKNNPNKLKDLSYIKSIVSGSAHLESSLQYELDEQLKQRGCKIKVGPGYGQNEGGPGLSFSSDTFLENRKPNCCGYPLPFTTISIFNPLTDEELKYGEDLEGEIRYIAPCAMKGYAFNRKVETSKFYRVGLDGKIWACSGDIGKIDKDGGIYITDRITRQISRNGFKLAPTEIEDLILSNIKGIESCALVGKPDETEENKLILYYSIKKEERQNEPIITEAIITLCNTLKEYKIPNEYILKDEIPLTPNLKIDFKKLEREALEADFGYVRKRN